MARLFDLARRPNAAQVAVGHELDHETPVVGRVASYVSIGTEGRVEVEHLVDQLTCEAREVFLGQPVPDRWA